MYKLESPTSKLKFRLSEFNSNEAAMRAKDILCSNINRIIGEDLAPAKYIHIITQTNIDKHLMARIMQAMQQHCLPHGGFRDKSMYQQNKVIRLQSSGIDTIKYHT